MKGLILTYILAGSATVAGLRYPAIGLLGYVFFAILRPHFLFGFAGDVAPISDWMGTAMLIGWAFNGFGSWKFGRARLIVAALVVFLLWFVLSAVQALETQPAYVSIVSLSKFMLPVLVGVTVLEDETYRRWMLWAIVLAQGYVGFEMNLEYVRGFNIASSGFGGMDNNCFGAGLVAAIGPAVALVIASKKWYQRAIAGAAAALILHTALLTFSRGTMVGMLAVAFTGFVMIPKRPRNVAIMVLAIAIVVRFTGPELAERYRTTFAPAEERDASAESRLDLWRDCLLVVAEYPIFGVGPANWRVIASQYGWPPGKSAHSVWMETAAENGIPGALFLLSFFSLPGILLWRVAREPVTDDNRWDVAIAIGTVLSGVGFVVAGQFVSVAGLEIPYYVVMVGAGLLKGRSLKSASASASAAEVRSEPAPTPVVPVPAINPHYRPPAATPALAAGAQRPAPAAGRILAIPARPGSRGAASD